jgi:hypothetical protein
MDDGPRSLRVLQVLGDTDDDDDGRAALDLHRQLTRAGIEIRTLALAPGTQAGLASIVPTMSPSARSIAAHTQLRREQRWADVVVLRGEAPAAAAGLAHVRTAPPTVLALGVEAQRWLTGPVPPRVVRLVGRVAAVVVTCGADATVGDRLGLGAGAVRVIPYGVDAGTVVTSAQRAAARSGLGLPDDVLVAHLVGRGPALDAARRRADELGVARTEAEAVDDRVVRFGDAEEPDRTELVVAAADLVVAAGEVAGPPPAVLSAAAAGLAVVGPSSGALGDLVDDTTGWSELDAAVAAGTDEVRRRGAVAAQRVQQRFALADVGAEWEAVLRSVAGR